FEKSLVDAEPLMRDHAHIDFRLRVIEADPDETIAVVLHLHDCAVVCPSRQPLDQAVINPRMPRDDPVRFPPLQQHCRQRIHITLPYHRCPLILILISSAREFWPNPPRNLFWPFGSSRISGKRSKL